VFKGVMVGFWRKLYNENFHYFLSPNCNRVINSRNARWVGNVACMGEIRIRS
jgi:hypothetical protein